MTEACIVGWAHLQFCKLDAPDLEALVGTVAGSAIPDAGIAPGEIDGAFVSNFNNGFSKRNFLGSLPMQSLPELQFKPTMLCGPGPRTSPTEDRPCQPCYSRPLVYGL